MHSMQDGLPPGRLGFVCTGLARGIASQFKCMISPITSLFFMLFGILARLLCLLTPNYILQRWHGYLKMQVYVWSLSVKRPKIILSEHLVLTRIHSCVLCQKLALGRWCLVLLPLLSRRAIRTIWLGSFIPQVPRCSRRVPK